MTAVAPRPKAVVAGTGFGRVYLAGLADPRSPVELAGVLARGGERSRACAQRYGVPLYQRVEAVPDDIRFACVVVGGAATGGPGAQIAAGLLGRGVHVLQEHPVHRAELAGCLRAARAAGAAYRVNTHHRHVEPVQRFVAAVRALAQVQEPLFVDAMCGYQVLYTLLDILGTALGRVSPSGFSTPGPVLAAGRTQPDERPYRSLDGVLGGVPLTLRVQNQLDPEEPDNHAHLWHRITVGFEGGHLTLVSGAGPVLWSVPPHLPRSASRTTGFDQLDSDALKHPGTVALGPAEAPSWSGVLTREWPAAVRAAVAELADDARSGADPMPHGQYHLSLIAAWQEITDRLGPVRLVSRSTPRILSADEVAVLVPALAGSAVRKES